MNLRRLYWITAVAMMGLSTGCLFPDHGHRREPRPELRRDKWPDQKRDKDHEEKREPGTEASVPAHG
jgi:hypothetical protein